MLEVIAKFVETNMRTICVVLALTVISLPVIVAFLYSPLLPDVFISEVSADGLLSYFGGVIGALAAIFVGMIAVFQNVDAVNREKKTRREAVRPLLQMKLVKDVKNSFKITLFNNTPDRPVYDIALHKQVVFRVLDDSQENDFTLCFGKSSESVGKKRFVELDLRHQNLNKAGFPTEIELSYRDADQNMISQKFFYDQPTYDENNKYMYVPSEVKYH